MSRRLIYLIQKDYTIPGIFVLLVLFVLFHPGMLLAEEMALDIDTVIKKSLSNNLSLKIEKITADISEETLKSSRSVFDPSLSMSGSVARSVSDSALSTDGTINKNGDDAETVYGFTQGISKPFKSGGSMSLYLKISHYDVSDERLTSTSDDTTIENISTDETTTENSYNYYSSKTEFAVSQPLLKNRGVKINTTDILMSENNKKISELNFKQKVIDILSDAQKLYWGSFAAQERLNASKQSLTLAKKFLDEAIEKVKMGDLVPIDTLQARAEVAQRYEDVILLENEMNNSHDKLLYFISGKATSDAVVSLIQKPEFKKIEINEGEMIEGALQRRTEYEIANINVESSNLSVIYTKNQKLPEVDINATISINGLEDSFGSSMEKMAKTNNYEGKVTLSVEFPWGFKKDNAVYMESVLQKRQSIHALHETEQQIILEVRTAIRNLSALERKYLASLISKRLGEEKLQAEENKYKHGLSTSYTILQHQRDLAVSTVNNIDALIEYQLAVVNLDKVAGLGAWMK